MFRSRAVIGALTLLLLGSLLNAAPAEATGRVSGSVPDSVTVTGDNFELDRPADVVAGDLDSAIKISFVAGPPISDGTIRLVLSRAAWPTSLRPVRAFYGAYPFSTDDRGAVSVLPGEQLPIREPACEGRGPAGEVLPADWSVDARPGFQVVTIRHATCGAGHRLVVRIKGVAAPARVGSFLIPVLTESTAGLPRVAVGRIRVLPVPRVALSVSVPETFPADQNVIVTITPTGPPDAVGRYQGAVALVSEPEDCTLSPRDGVVAAQFHPGDAGTQFVAVSLGQHTAHRLRAYDVANQAVAGVSNYFSVVGPSNPQICPASFH